MGGRGGGQAPHGRPKQTKDKRGKTRGKSRPRRGRLPAAARRRDVIPTTGRPGSFPPGLTRSSTRGAPPAGTMGNDRPAGDHSTRAQRALSALLGPGPWVTTGRPGIIPPGGGPPRSRSRGLLRPGPYSTPAGRPGFRPTRPGNRTPRPASDTAPPPSAASRLGALPQPGHAGPNRTTLPDPPAHPADRLRLGQIGASPPPGHRDLAEAESITTCPAAGVPSRPPRQRGHRANPPQRPRTPPSLDHNSGCAKSGRHRHPDTPTWTKPSRSPRQRRLPRRRVAGTPLPGGAGGTAGRGVEAVGAGGVTYPIDMKCPGTWPKIVHECPDRSRKSSV
jgi:hypothetical protein